MQYPKDFTSELRRKPICGVLSVAMIAGTSFKKATQAIKDNMMPFQKRHGGKTYHEQRLGALEDLGVSYRELPVNERRTLGTVVELVCRPSRTYMINTSRHVVTVRDGIVADQYEIKEAHEHGARRCFVKNITEIW